MSGNLIRNSGSLICVYSMTWSVHGMNAVYHLQHLMGREAASQNAFWGAFLFRSRAALSCS